MYVVKYTLYLLIRYWWIFVLAVAIRIAFPSVREAFITFQSTVEQPTTSQIQTTIPN